MPCQQCGTVTVLWHRTYTLQSVDKTFVEYFLQDYEHPMVVATFKSKENILKVLPPTEELENLLEGVG